MKQVKWITFKEWASQNDFETPTVYTMAKMGKFPKGVLKEIKTEKTTYLIREDYKQKRIRARPK